MQKGSTVRIAAVVLLLLLSLYAKVSLGQAVTGTLLGTVQDSTGAVVSNASVTLTNEGTNVTDRTTSSQQGFYTFPNLMPGQYSVTVEARGFKTEIAKHNQVNVEQSTRVDVSLSPGAVNEQVTVNSAAAPLVETTTSDLGTTIDQTQISNLPINGRNPAMLMQLAPGTTPSGWGAGNGEDSSTASTTSTNAYTATNGFPFEANLYLVDGVSDVELENGYMGLQLPFDFIGEMKLETSDPTAEYGTYGAQVSNITTKTGTNKFHGQVFEFNRNTDLNEPDYFSKVNPPFHYNQFGGEVDGPIIKDKLFFAADFQWLRLAEGTSGIWSLPTAAARSGNLSAFDVTTGGNTYGPIGNPMACYWSALANGVESPAACTASSAISPGTGTADTVPAADIVPIAAAFLSSSVWPLPNLSGAVNNATYVQLNDASEPQEDARVDWQFSRNDHFFGRMGYSNRTLTQPLDVSGSSTPNPFMNDGNINATNQTSNDVVGWDHTFSASMMNELRLGFSRFATTDFVPAYGISENNVLGVPNGNIAAYPDTSGIAAVDISGFNGTGDAGWPPNALGRLSNIYQLNDAFTIVHGRHTWKFGFVLEPIQARVYNAQNDPRGQFSATGAITGVPLAPQYGGVIASNPAQGNGSALADWLVGALGSGNCQGAAVCRDHFFDKPNTRTTNIGEFAQDDYRLTSKVTLNLGVRYDVYTHPVDTRNLQSNFVTTGADAGLIQVASSGNRGPNVNTYYGDVAPRLGVAYTPDNGKTAFRAGLGVSYYNDNFGADGGTLERNFPELEQENNGASESNCSTPYGVTPTSGPTLANPNSAEYSTCGSLILQNGLPGNSTSGTPVYTPIVPYSVTPGGTIASPLGFGVYQVASNFRQDLATEWNVSIERSLGGNMAIHAAYVGDGGNHLYHDWQLNQCNPPSYDVATTPPAYPACLPFYGIAPGISTMDFRNSGGKSHYNAGQFVFERRAGANLTFTAAYTWSKMMDNIDNPIDSYDLHEELDTAGGFQHANTPQSLTATYVYTLPFGRGQQFANSISPAEDAIVGGWSVSGVTWFRSGGPLLISGNSEYLLPQNGGQRANFSCAEAVNPHTTAEWFDTGCFSQPVGFVLGNDGVAEGSIYGPRYLSWDMSFGKAVHIRESMQLKLEGQFFNIFNRVNYSNPDTGVTDSSFGVISGDVLPRQGQLGMVFSF